ncbi:hypothetical protein NKH77_28635 [Streptomyces sp. M19]
MRLDNELPATEVLGDDRMPVRDAALAPVDHVKLQMVRPGVWAGPLDVTAANATLRIWQSAYADFAGTVPDGPTRVDADRAWDTAVSLMLPPQQHPCSRTPGTQEARTGSRCVSSPTTCWPTARTRTRLGRWPTRFARTWASPVASRPGPRLHQHRLPGPGRGQDRPPTPLTTTDSSFADSSSTEGTSVATSAAADATVSGTPRKTPPGRRCPAARARQPAAPGRTAPESAEAFWPDAETQGKTRPPCRCPIRRWPPVRCWVRCRSWGRGCRGCRRTSGRGSCRCCRRTRGRRWPGIRWWSVRCGRVCPPLISQRRPHS